MAATTGSDCSLQPDEVFEMTTENSGVDSEIPELIPCRMLNEYVYCPRLAYIEWVQSDFADNFHTVEGRNKHRVVDRETGKLPEDTGCEDFEARSVWLSAPHERLTSRMDLVTGSSGETTVVDYKKGAVPANPERSWPSDRVQLCAQGLVLRENGHACDHGILYYIASKTKVEISFTEELVEYTRQTVRDLINLAQSGQIPLPIENSAKCVGCSIAGICLPDETNLIVRSGQDLVKDSEIRRILPARDDSLPLYVQEQGAVISKSGELFEISNKKIKLGQARIFETSQVSVFGNVQVTTQALREMIYRDIPLSFFSVGGWFYGLAHGMSHKNVEIRRSQFNAAENHDMRLKLSSSIVSAKIRNSRTLLMRNHNDLPNEISARLKRLASESLQATSTESLLGVEGAAAHDYFSAFSGMIKQRARKEDESALTFDFNGRNRRPPTDPVNAMLSYAYSLLTKDLTVTAFFVGLDPFLGFYHRPRFGRPALALDLMEEFRPLIADSVVISVINNGIVTPGDFIRRGPSVALNDVARKKFIQAYENRMDSLIAHPVFGYRISYRRALEVQTRLMARVISGEIPDYPAFTTR